MSNGTIFLVVVLIAVVAFAFLRCQLWLSRAELHHNKERKFGASGDYICVTVMYDGKPLRLLLTPRELAVAKNRAKRQLEAFNKSHCANL